MGYLRGQAAAYKSRTHYCWLSYSRVKKSWKLLSYNISRIALDRVKLKILKFLDSISILDKIIKGDRLTVWEVDIWVNRWLSLSSFQFLQRYIILKVPENIRYNLWIHTTQYLNDRILLKRKNLKLFEDILLLYSYNLY